MIHGADSVFVFSEMGYLLYLFFSSVDIIAIRPLQAEVSKSTLMISFVEVNRSI